GGGPTNKKKYQISFGILGKNKIQNGMQKKMNHKLAIIFQTRGKKIESHQKPPKLKRGVEIASGHAQKQGLPPKYAWKNDPT
ncbi:hypothetical protein ACQWFX_25495, partial [Salmonella enterica subsp. enterica serovar Infantis]